MNKFVSIAFSIACAVLLAGCAGFEGRGLVPGKSTASEVETVMGAAADKRPGAAGETVYYFPRLPWGYVTYAARIAPDGRLVALEQRLTQANVEKLKVNVTRADEVRDLLGPPFEPMKMPLKDAEIWTYPMRLPGFPTPRWLLVQITSDGVVRDIYSINDPHYDAADSPRCC
jgi:hypothetical protein